MTHCRTCDGIKSVESVSKLCPLFVFPFLDDFINAEDFVIDIANIFALLDFSKSGLELGSLPSYPLWFEQPSPEILDHSNIRN